jgi:photosystem II stability/assembly factor-like uncharacterized protein
LTGGASPSASVCWLIGRGGVVLRSIDGLRFESVPFPEPIDLTTIHSTGALQATIAAADGRVFATTDGGASWRTVGQ